MWQSDLPGEVLRLRLAWDSLELALAGDVRFRHFGVNQ